MLARARAGRPIYVRVPNYGSLNRKMLGAKWCGFRYPDHVNYFTTKSLGAMAGDCGLKLKLLNPPPPSPRRQYQRGPARAEWEGDGESHLIWLHSYT